MRFKHFKPRALTEADLQKLDELRMNPTTLQQFGASDTAKGIMAGFEAELVFTGLGGDSDDDYDMEPDMDADERCRSIDQVIEFFSDDEWGYGTTGRDLDKLQEGLDEMYWEWHDGAMRDAFADEQEELIKKAIEEDDFDWEDETRKQLDMMDLSDDEIEEAMKQGAGAPKFDRSSEQEEYAQANPGYQRYLEAREQADGLLDDLVQDSINSQDKHYDYALDEFRDSFYMDDDSGFFSDVGLRWMSDVQDQFELMWPVMTGTGSSEGGFSEYNAEQLAKTLSDELGVKTKVSSGYHSAKRDNVTWIFEPDSSLDADDSDNMPVEIVSPPMPLEECLRQMENFFAWAETNGAYANSSTGFHMGVSLPHRGGAVDYVKLALFLGDEYVLKEFGRSGNHFTAAAIKKIRDRVKGNKEAIGNALELMKNNLIELAQKALEINNHGFGKYTSINPQGGRDSTKPHEERGAKYIEFRSAGGSNYFEDIDKLKNTLLRYAQAMTIAADPSAERKEYYKKLYKLISPPEGDPAIDLFSRFATGAISSEELKKSWADKQLSAEPKGDWKLWNATNGVAVPGHEYHGYTKSDAWEKAKKSIQPGSSIEDFQRAYKLLPTKSQTGDWEVYSVDSGETLEVLHGFETKGAAADSVYDKYAEQGIGFNLRPADPEQPEKPLTQREKLAKNIKAAPAEEIKNWKVYDTKTGEVHYEQEGRKSNLVQAMRTFERERKLPMGTLAIKEIPGTKQEPVDGDDGKRHKWEFYYAPTGRVLDTVSDASIMQARAVLSDTQRRYNDLDADQIRMRTVPTDASRDRYNDRQELEPDVSGPPEGFLTQRPATGDYYEVRGDNDRVYGYISSDAGRAPGGMGLARTARDYVNNLTGGDRSYVQYRAGDPVQARTTNGVPIWELYDKFSGSSLYTIINNTSEDALKAGIRWLRDHGAEEPATYADRFGIRPKMSA